MNNYNTVEVAQKIIENIQKEYKELNKLNVMVLGKTGVGKSTLINNMFMENIVKTGTGKPVTQNIRKVTKPDFPLAIYDTPGLELGGEHDIENLLNQVIDIIRNGFRSGDVGEAIHCIWYCINTHSNRFEQTEIDFLKNFLNKTSIYNVPIIIVLTQSFSVEAARQMKWEIEKENLPIVGTVPVLAADYKINDEYTAKSFGLDTLASMMNSVIPDAVKKTFVAIQSVNLELKIEKAHAVVIASASAAAATGAVPIPFSDAAVLIPEQVAMLAGITACFGLQLEKATLTAIVSSTIGTAGTTVLGKSIVSGLLKCIPGVGSVVGGAISAATAGALTVALGEAYIILLTKICKGDMKIEDLDTKKGKATIKDIFIEQLKVKRS